MMTKPEDVYIENYRYVVGSVLEINPDQWKAFFGKESKNFPTRRRAINWVLRQEASVKAQFQGILAQGARDGYRYPPLTG